MTVQAVPPTGVEAMEYLVNYADLSDSPKESLLSAFEVCQAIGTICKESHVPLWFIIEWSAACDTSDTVESLQHAYEDWKIWHATAAVVEVPEDEVPF